MKTGILAALAATAIVGFAGAGTSASAAVQLLAGQEGCDLYSADGCLFSHGGGGEFDDPALLVAAYNAAHNATPAPSDLPNLIYLGKHEAGVDFDDDVTTVTFTDLPFQVSFYSVKVANSLIQVFGLNPATDSFTASNTGIFNKPPGEKGRNLQGISHVTFYGVTETAVPEPGAWALMIMGFGAAGAMLRRRRTVAA